MLNRRESCQLWLLRVSDYLTTVISSDRSWPRAKRSRWNYLHAGGLRTPPPKNGGLSSGKRERRESPVRLSGSVQSRSVRAFIDVSFGRVADTVCTDRSKQLNNDAGPRHTHTYTYTETLSPWNRRGNWRWQRLIERTGFYPTIDYLLYETNLT